MLNIPEYIHYFMYRSCEILKSTFSAIFSELKEKSPRKSISRSRKIYITNTEWTFNATVFENINSQVFFNLF